mmetsp:Transcript_69181/g.193423  ORF Transcript_69181/g.193423 Transcript_69181/m.193423 type:complete len:143 (-) Transcript_69181:2558-2986(-)
MPQVVIEIASLAPYEEAATQVEINWANRNILEPISRRLVELKAGASDFDKMTLGDHPFMWFALVLRRIANNGPVGAEGQDTNSKDPHSVVNALRAAQYFAATRFKVRDGDCSESADANVLDGLPSSTSLETILDQNNIVDTS